MMLLFLKRVQKIDVHEWLPGDGAPMLRFSCGLQTPSSSLLAQRSLFARAAADPGALLLPDMMWLAAEGSSHERLFG